MKIKNLKIEKYLKDLSSKKSMPGGGSVAALNASLGYALILMVCNLSLGKERYKPYEKLIKTAIYTANKNQNLCVNFIDEDILYFKNIEKVFKMKNETIQQKNKKKAAMEKACKICCKVPKKIMNISDEGLKLVRSLIGKTNTSASSDLEVATECFIAAKNSAYINILINLKSINDKNFIKKYKKY